MKRIRFGLIFLSILFSLTNIYGATDSKIFSDTILNTYQGNNDAQETIKNIKFTDINNTWAKEAIVKAGAFNMVKGYSSRYNPNGNVSNQEALAFVLRLIGLEQEAQDEANAIKNQYPFNNTMEIWSLGYLSVARNRNLITNDEFNQAVSPNQESLPSTAFKRGAYATRENVADWLIKAMNQVLQTPLTSDVQQSIYKYSDWGSISSERINSVEIALDNGIMAGVSSTRFDPKGRLTRAQMAQLLVNTDSAYNSIWGLSKKIGTVGGIKDIQSNETGKASLERNIYIRTNDGKVDLIKYYMEQSDAPKVSNKDSVVYNQGAITGLSSLREGNEIEYIVEDKTNTIKFVNVKDKNILNKPISGKLNKIDYQNNIIKILDNSGKELDYYFAQGLAGADEKGNYVFFDNKKIYEKDVPIGAMVKLDSKNNIIVLISYVGNANLYKEIRGFVVENNPEFGYLTIVDDNGKEVTSNYLADQIEVEKQPYYSGEDDLGYLNQMFPNFKYDARNTSIDKIEAGDVVFITLEQGTNLIEKISASPNYFMRYGKITQLTSGDNITNILVQFDTGETSWYNISNNIFISKGGKPVSLTNLKSGDWVKLLVNEAVIEAGNSVESVKEIAIEEAGHEIGDILKGKVLSIDSIQREMLLEDSYVLKKDGWNDYKQIRKLSIDNRNIEYFYNKDKVNLDFVNKFLKRASGEVYVALEKSFLGDTISKVTFRNERDEILNPDIIVNSDGMGNFAIAGTRLLNADEGTIIRKDGKLVNLSSININDYARVSLNGEGKAAIIDIYDYPVVGGVTIARGRVKSIDTGKSFVVKSLSQLSGDKWSYSPVERKFIIDNNTVYIDKDGIKDINQFIGYTANTSIDKTFTIIYNGSKATHIIEAPYPTKSVSGVIYNIEGKKVSLKEGKYLKATNVWEEVSLKDPSINLTTEVNTIIIKNNKVISLSELENGDKVRAMTESLPEKVVSGIEVNARIIFVEN